MKWPMADDEAGIGHRPSIIGHQSLLGARSGRREVAERGQELVHPGCGAPAQWADAHHLVHWADGGATDLDNAALLCERHHTVVHHRRYAGRLVQGPEGPRVDWDLRPGSYDEQLAQLAAREPA